MNLLKSLPKSVTKLLNNEMLLVVGGLLLLYLVMTYSQHKSSQGPVEAPSEAPAAPSQAMDSGMGGVPSLPQNNGGENVPQDLLPADSNSEWSEFAPQGQGDLQGSGSLLHPEISQRPFNSVQGANALRGDPQIAIGDVPSIAAPSNPIQGQARGLN